MLGESYWDFALPSRKNKKVFTKRFLLYFSLQVITTFILWIIIWSIGGESSFNSGGRIPITVSDLSTIVLWFIVARINWIVFNFKTKKN